MEDVQWTEGKMHAVIISEEENKYNQNLVSQFNKTVWLLKLLQLFNLL